MKILLASLMCLVLTAAECFALKGGPPYPGSTKSISGTYAGIMQGVFDPTNPRSSNTLALFTLSIPQSGLATGVVVAFVAGRAFVGTVSALGDPNKATLRGVVQTSTETKLILCTAAGTPLETTVTDRADGNIDAKIQRTSTASISVAGTLLVGTALLNATQTVKSPTNCQAVVENPFSLSLIVDGFKQTNG